MDAVGTARAFVREAFPQARAAVLGGSAARGQATATSDLDIVVILDGPPAPYRETLRYGGWLVELFAKTPSPLREVLRTRCADAALRRPGDRLCDRRHPARPRRGRGDAARRRRVPRRRASS